MMKATIAKAEERCTVCQEEFQGAEKQPRTPLLLSCGHSICRSCLATIVARSSTKTGVECPMCRAVTPLPQAGDISSLRTNFSLVSLLSVVHSSSSSSPAATHVVVPPAGAATNKSCDECGNGATVFCGKCHAQFCAKCDAETHKPRVLATHNRVPVAERATTEKPRCSAHHKKLRLYCKDHKEMCCSHCLQTTHKGHNVVAIEEAMADVERGVQENVEKLKVFLQSVDGDVKAAEVFAAIDELHASHIQAVTLLTREFEAIREAVDSRERELQAQLQAKFETANKELEAQRDLMSTSLASIHTVIEAGVRIAALQQQQQHSVEELQAVFEVQRTVDDAVMASRRCVEIVVRPRTVAVDVSSREVHQVIASAGTVLESFVLSSRRSDETFPAERLHPPEPAAKAPAKLPSAPTSTLANTTLFVSNLPFIVDDEGLLEIFEGMRVKKAHVVCRPNGRSKGYGFVTFNNETDCRGALEAVDKSIVEGREITVRLATSL